MSLDRISGWKKIVTVSASNLKISGKFNAFILIEMFTAMLNGSYLWIAGLVSNGAYV